MALPTHTTVHASALGAAYGKMTRYIVQQPDILDLHPDDINETVKLLQIQEEETGRIIWTQERLHNPQEIVDSLLLVPPPLSPQDGASSQRSLNTNRALWTTHRPTQGWYIRLKSPSLPSTAFIPLAPSTPGRTNGSGSGHSSVTTVPDGAFSFSCRTQVDMSRAERSPIHSPHTYPPPSSLVSSPRESLSFMRESPRPRMGQMSSYDMSKGSASSSANQSISSLASVTSTVVDIPLDRPFTFQPLSPNPRAEITTFLVMPQPHLPPPHHHKPGAFLSALQSVFSFESKRSFTIQPPSLPPVLLFHDVTPMMSVRSSAVIELDEGIARVLGVERSFYIAVALAFWDFLGDKEAYLAAADG